MACGPFIDAEATSNWNFSLVNKWDMMRNFWPNEVSDKIFFLKCSGRANHIKREWKIQFYKCIS